MALLMVANEFDENNESRRTGERYLLRRVAVCLEAYARIPVIEFGTRLLAGVARNLAPAPMQATRGQATGNYQTIRRSPLRSVVGRRNPYSSAT